MVVTQVVLVQLIVAEVEAGLDHRASEQMAGMVTIAVMVVLVETQAAEDEEAVVGFRLFQAVARLKREGKSVRVGVMAPEEFKSDVRTADFVFGWGRWSDLDSLAQRLFAGLRWLDAQEATHIVCPLPAERGIGRAMRDRLEKAAWLPVV